jgi:hypothetical protein
MILTLDLAWCILMVRGAEDALASRALFDWGILAKPFSQHGQPPPSNSKRTARFL